ncbi:unnamed protein product, partial [Brassica rapa]
CPFFWKLWPAALVTGKASIPYLLYNPFVFSDEDCLLPERTIYSAQGWLLRALTPPTNIFKF